MPKALRPIWIFLGLPIVLASCAGNGNSGGGGCPANISLAPQMISPAKGATNVSLSLGAVYFSPASPSTTNSIGLTASPGGAVILGGPLVQAPLPLPSDIAGNSGTVYESTLAVALAPKTTYVVSATIASGCGPVTETVGTFTTQ